VGVGAAPAKALELANPASSVITSNMLGALSGALTPLMKCPCEDSASVNPTVLSNDCGAIGRLSLFGYGWSDALAARLVAANKTKTSANFVFIIIIQIVVYS
jgi:hypothetical protein